MCRDFVFYVLLMMTLFGLLLTVAICVDDVSWGMDYGRVDAQQATSEFKIDLEPLRKEK
jgi:hypothetical protein